MSRLREAVSAALYWIGTAALVTIDVVRDSADVLLFIAFCALVFWIVLGVCA